MTNNSIDEVGILAISTRLQRLSDRLRKDGEQIYKLFDVDFQPKWFPVILTLYKKENLTVTELADEIGYAHPSTIALLKDLEKKKIVKSQNDKNDERKRRLSLTKGGIEMVEKMQPVWEVMREALSQLLETPTPIIKAIEETEALLDRQTFLQRAIAVQDKTKQATRG